jgi:hypothetical protein
MQQQLCAGRTVRTRPYCSAAAPLTDCLRGPDRLRRDSDLTANGVSGTLPSLLGSVATLSALCVANAPLAFGPQPPLAAHALTRRATPARWGPTRCRARYRRRGATWRSCHICAPAAACAKPFARRHLTALLPCGTAAGRCRATS